MQEAMNQDLCNYFTPFQCDVTLPAHKKIPTILYSYLVALVLCSKNDDGPSILYIFPVVIFTVPTITDNWQLLSGQKIVQFLHSCSGGEVKRLRSR